ncbi:MAG: phosphoribosylformylglycinamidine cyclo-ligase [Bacteroidia bacterium]|nr:phosphoribosylformylglycinamidine cyclo-ligase [Bacteroidia bacterium]
MPTESKYSKRGVSSQKEDVHAAIKNIDKGLYPKAFCKIVPDLLGGDKEYCNIMNKKLIPGEVISAIINGAEEFIQKLRDLGIGIFSTGGETADVGDLVRTIIVDSTVAARMKRKDVISNHNIRAGDIIIGLASSGQTTYEDEYNTGMGSNGLTSARHDVFSKYLASKYPESFDPSLTKDLFYSGKIELTDPIKGLNINAGRMVLSPTRTYAPVVKKITEVMRSEIHGMIHCSGGGQTKILHFVDNLHVVKNNMFPLPPLFRIIHEESGTDWKEMYQVFNMGHRFEIYTDKKNAEEIISIAASFNLEARIVGQCKASDNKRLTIVSEFGNFEY